MIEYWGGNSFIHWVVKWQYVISVVIWVLIGAGLIVLFV